MNRSILGKELKNSYQSFVDFIQSLDESDFLFAPPNKWTAGQQLQHLVLSVKPLNKALLMPKLALTSMFGKANRPSKSYDDLVAKYQDKLKGVQGKPAPSEYTPAPIPYAESNQLCNTLIKEVEKLARKIEKTKESNLDIIILPHPLMGKVTLREMVYFTIYHATHHLNHIKNGLSQQ